MPFVDTLLRLAERRIFRPYWSERILAETVDALADMGHGRERAEWRVEAMRRVFPEAMVTVVSEVETPLGLPDPDDDHVLQAAILCPATTILTHNARDFPPSICESFGIEVVNPDGFLLEQFDRYPAIVCDVVVQQARDLQNPAVTVERLLAGLWRDAPVASKRIAQALN